MPPGQVYVALSRCTTLDGIVLQSRIKSNGFFTDERIVCFSQKNSSASVLEKELQESRKNYQLEILLSLFDYKIIVDDANELRKYLLEHKSSFNQESEKWIYGIINKANEIHVTAGKFQSQLNSLFLNEAQWESNTVLQERIKAGSAYFINEQDKLLELVLKSSVVTDSRIHAKEFNDGLKELFVQLSRNKHMLGGLVEKFDMETYHNRKKQFVLPAFTVNVYAGVSKQRVDSPHPLLHQQLRKMRDSICAKKDLPIYIVAGTATLDEMARYLPQTLAELRKISGFGDAKIEKYGQQFLDVVLNYCGEKNLSSLIHEKSPKRERKERSGEKKPKVDTKAESFRLYKEGKSVEKIAKERNFTVQTIEGHLAHYVQSGEIKISELVSREKIVLIEPAVKNFAGGSITPIKEKLGSNISFGEIRLVLAWVEFQKSLSSHKDH